MGGAIARGMASGNIVQASDITVADISDDTLAKINAFDPAIETTKDGRAAVKGADLVVIAVKPWLLEEVVGNIKDVLDYRTQAVASIVAGVTFASLKKMLDNGSGKFPVLFRVMPNTAVSVGEGVNFIAYDGASVEQVDDLSAIFSELGPTFVVEEKMIGPATSLASCGIAFALKYIDAAIKGGVEQGFSQEDARIIVMQTVRGALAMMESNGTMPQVEIDKVTTPGGVTLKGLKAMAEAGFDEAVLAGLRESK